MSDFNLKVTQGHAYCRYSMSLTIIIGGYLQRICLVPSEILPLLQRTACDHNRAGGRARRGTHRPRALEFGGALGLYNKHLIWPFLYYTMLYYTVYRYAWLVSRLNQACLGPWTCFPRLPLLDLEKSFSFDKAVIVRSLIRVNITYLTRAVVLMHPLITVWWCIASEPSRLCHCEFPAQLYTDATRTGSVCSRSTASATHHECTKNDNRLQLFTNMQQPCWCCSSFLYLHHHHHHHCQQWFSPNIFGMQFVKTTFDVWTMAHMGAFGPQYLGRIDAMDDHHNRCHCGHH